MDGLGGYTEDAMNRAVLILLIAFVLAWGFFFHRRAMMNDAWKCTNCGPAAQSR
jgi:hypothetical protein